MARFPTRSVIGLVLVLSLGACTKTIRLSNYNFPPRTDSAEVELIDARAMSRQQLDQVLQVYDVLARNHVLVRTGDRYENDVAEKVEAQKPMVRGLGGHALLYTHNSQVIAAIMQDARYAGPDDRLVVYALRRKES